MNATILHDKYIESEAMIVTLSRRVLLFFLFLPLTAYAQNRPTGTIQHQQIVDADGDGFADPGDVVRFTVTVTNPDASPFDGTIVTLDTYTAGTLLESSTILSQGTFTHDDRTITITLGTLAPLASATFVYDQSVNGPVGFEAPGALCGNGSLKFPDESSVPLVVLNGEQIGFGSCVLKVDFDDDEIADNEDVCINVPHTTTRLDQVIPSSGATNHIITNSINIARKGLITSSDVSLKIMHSWVGDLVVRLTHVNTGTSVVLIDRPGVPASAFGCDGNNIQGNFSAQGFPTAENACFNLPPLAAISGIFSSQEPLEAFNGESMSGEWKLTIEDQFPSGDGGSLVQWCINLEGSTEISTSVSAPATNLSNDKFVQRLTVTNNGPSDLLDFSIRHAAPVGLSLKKAELVTNGSRQALPALIAIPLGNSVAAEFEVEPAVAYPYRELIVSSPASVAGTYESSAAPLSTQLSSAGVSGQVVMAEFLSNFGTCSLQNAQALQGKIALIPLVFCQTQIVVDQVAAAGPQAIIMRINYVSDPFLLAKPLPLINAVGFPVVSPANGIFDSIAGAPGAQVTLRANPDRKKWSLTSSFDLYSARVRVLNTEQIRDSYRTATEIHVDSDLDGTGDVNDQCSADPAKTVAGICGCGVADIDSDSDGIIDCSTGRKVYARYSSLLSLMSSVKPLKLSGNRKRDAAKKRALKEKVLKIKTIVAEIEALITNPTKTILLSNPAINLASESSSIRKKINAALKTSSPRFSKNKKAAVSSLKKILGLIVNSD